MPMGGPLPTIEYHAPDPADLWQPFFHIGDLLVTRTMVITFLATLAVMLLLWLGVRNVKTVPGKGQWFLEAIYGFVRNDIALSLIGGKHFKRFVPLLFSLLIFIFTLNLMGLFPFTMTAPTSVIAVPIVLTAVVYITYLFVGFRDKGFVGYFKHMVPSGVPAYIAPVVLLLEMFSFFITRPLTLALRLFGNMFAGHMLIVLFVIGGAYLLTQGPALAAAGVGALVMAVLMFIFKMLILTVQAYVFTLLSASYLGDSVAESH